MNAMLMDWLLGQIGIRPAIADVRCAARVVIVGAFAAHFVQLLLCGIAYYLLATLKAPYQRQISCAIDLAHLPT
jgi:hypothetical protein